MGANVTAGSTTRPNGLGILMPVILVLSILELHLYRIPLAGLGAELKNIDLLMRMAHPWGTLTHALAAALAAAALVMVTTNIFSGPTPRERAGYWPTALMLALMAAAVYQLASGGASSTVSLQAVSILLVGYMALRFIRQGYGLWEKIMVVLLTAYQLIPRLVLAANVSMRQTTIGGFTATSTIMLNAAEFIMAGALIALLPAYMHHFRRLNLRRKIRPLIVASSIIAMLIKFYLDNPQLMRITISRTSGLQLLLPFPVYLFIIWTVIFMAITLRASQSGRRSIGYAIVFIFISGFLLVNPYQHLLSGLGFAMLGMGNSSDTG